MSKRLADRLSAARHHQFVGRAAEQLIFELALRASALPFTVLHVHGPAGVGKTTLLRAYAAMCREAQLPAVVLDGRNLEPTPQGFLRALAAAVGAEPDTPLPALIPPHAGRLVLFVDTYELLAPLDNWLRDVYLPELPEHVLVVLAGQHPPAHAWRVDPGWQSLVRTLPLRNLSPEECRLYLANRQVPDEQHEALLDFTHGHPLALSLVADVMEQRPRQPFRPEHAPDVIRTLLGHFVQKVPSPDHRTALEACAVLRVTTESMVAELLGPAVDGHAVFEWLRGLSFVDAGPLGLFPHDLAREALSADLRWRNPDRYAELHRRARAYYGRRLTQTSGRAQERVLSDYAYLHRDNPVIKPFLEWSGVGGTLPDAYREADLPVLQEMVARHEGEASARLAAYWLARQPEHALVFRDARHTPVGFVLALSLAGLAETDVDADPAVRAACAYLHDHAPLRQGERGTYFRFWMSGDAYQGVSPVQSLIFLKMTQHYLTTPDLAFSFVAFADPGFWGPFCAYLDLFPVPEAGYDAAGRGYAVFGHDWRAVPPGPWLARLADRELERTPPAARPAPAPAPALRILDEAAFGAAVRQALRLFARPDRMASLPLLRSRLVVDQAGEAAGEAERIEVLRRLLQRAAAALQHAPREARYYRVLHRTFLHPAPSQEQAAEQLGLPFSTYRRHLRAGVAHVVDWLWRREIGAATFDAEQPAAANPGG